MLDGTLQTVLLGLTVLLYTLLWLDARQARTAATLTAQVVAYPSFAYGSETADALLTAILANAGPAAARGLRAKIWLTKDRSLKAPPSRIVWEVLTPPSIRHVTLKAKPAQDEAETFVTKQLMDEDLYFAAKWEWYDARGWPVLPFGRRKHSDRIGPVLLRDIYEGWLASGFLARQPSSVESEFIRQDQRDSRDKEQTAALKRAATALEALAKSRSGPAAGL